MHICRFFLQGKCDRGQFCGYAHGSHELGQRRATAAMQLPVCIEFKRGWCSRDNCKYHHIRNRKRKIPRKRLMQHKAVSTNEAPAKRPDSDSDASETEDSDSDASEGCAANFSRSIQAILAETSDPEEDFDSELASHAFDELRFFLYSRRPRMWRSQREGMRANLEPCKIVYARQTWWIVCGCQQTWWRLVDIHWWDERFNRPFCSSCCWPLPVRVEAWDTQLAIQAELANVDRS